MTEPDTRISFGDAATRLGLLWSHVNKLAKREVIPFERIAHLRFVKVGDLDAIREAARAAGYLRDAKPAATSKRRRAVAT